MGKHSRNLLFTVFFSCVFVQGYTQSFIHPGIDQSIEDLAYMKQLIDQRREPWKSAYDKLVETTDTTFVPHPYAHVLRGPYAIPNIGGDALSKSSGVAYNCALLWYITKDRHYAQTAIRILNAWSGTLWDFDYNDAKLLAGWTGHVLCNAAEILRYTDSKWSQGDVDRFTNMLMTVYYPLLRYYFPTANGNWDAAICHSLLSIAIFTNNRTLFNNTIDHLLHAPVNGSIFKYIYPNGECEESGRDQGHVQLGLGEFAGAAQVAFTQGVDLFSIGDDRIGRGYEYTTGYILGHTPYCYCEISPRTMHLGGDFEYVYRHYLAHGVLLPFVSKAADSMRGKTPRRALTAVRASFANPSKTSRTLVPDSGFEIMGADRNVPPIPTDALIVKPGQSIQGALDKAAGSDRWVVLSKGLYTLTEALKIPSGVTLCGQGTASVIFLKPEAGRDAIVNATDELHKITLRNFVIECALRSSPGADPNGSRSFNNKGYRGGIIFRADSVNRMSDLRFINLTVRNGTYNGVFISGANNLLFSGCDLNENGAAVVPGPKLQHNLILTHCKKITIENNRLDGSPYGAGVSLMNCEEASIEKNELARNAYYGVVVSESSAIIIKDNLVEGNDHSGIMFEFLHKGSENVSVVGNRIQFNGGYGVESYGAEHISLRGNVLLGNGIYSGAIDNSDQTKVTNSKRILMDVREN